MQAKYANKVGLPKKIYMHAEINAIIKCKQIERAYRLVVIRVLASGETGCAKPCPICSAAIAAIPSIKIVEHS